MNAGEEGEGTFRDVLWAVGSTKIAFVVVSLPPRTVGRTRRPAVLGCTDRLRRYEPPT